MTASYKENTQTPAANASASNVGTTQSNIPDDKIYTGLLFKDDHPTNEFPVSIQAFATPTAKTALLNGHSLAGDGLDRLGHMVHRRIVAHPSRDPSFAGADIDIQNRRIEDWKQGTKDGFERDIDACNTEVGNPSLQVASAADLTGASLQKSGLVPVSMAEVYNRGKAPTNTNRDISDFFPEWISSGRGAKVSTQLRNSWRPLQCDTGLGANFGPTQASADPITREYSDFSSNDSSGSRHGQDK
jgi:hypothetical protein